MLVNQTLLTLIYTATWWYCVWAVAHLHGYRLYTGCF